MNRVGWGAGRCTEAFRGSLAQEHCCTLRKVGVNRTVSPEIGTSLSLDSFSSLPGLAPRLNGEALL